jgi:predicted phosphodiesterase
MNNANHATDRSIMGWQRRRFLKLGSLALGSAAISTQVDPLAQSKPTTNQSSPSKLRIAAISDLNGAYGATTYDPEVSQAIALMERWQPDLVLCAGDIVAGQKRSLSREDIKAMWAGFDREIMSALQKFPFAPTIGNHDGSGALHQGEFIFQRDREIAAAYWQDRQNRLGIELLDSRRFPFTYSFRHQNIFFLVWDASTGKIPDTDLAIARENLASQAAQTADLRMVLGHLPLYAVGVGRDRPGDVLQDADQLRSLLERHRASTYICGHHHAYFPGEVGKLQTLHAGNLGSASRAWIGSDRVSPKTATLIDIDRTTQTTAYTTYNMATEQAIALDQIPQKIVAHNGTIQRRDLA